MNQFNEFGPFHPGDVCHIQNADFPENNGKLVTVTSELRMNRTLGGTEFVGHLTDAISPNGLTMAARPDQLRRRKPPTSGEDLILALIKDAPDTVNRRVPVAPHMASYDLLHAAIAVDGMVQRIEREILRGMRLSDCPSCWETPCACLIPNSDGWIKPAISGKP